MKRGEDMTPRHVTSCMLNTEKCRVWQSKINEA